MLYFILCVLQVIHVQYNIIIVNSALYQFWWTRFVEKSMRRIDVSVYTHYVWKRTIANRRGWIKYFPNDGFIYCYYTRIFCSIVPITRLYP